MQLSKSKCLSVLFILMIQAQFGFAQYDFYLKTDSLLNYLYLNNRFCGSVFIAKGDEILYNKQFDSHADEINEYHIGSITKMFTATIIYQLADEGKLSIADHLQKYFPQIPNAEDISIEQMLGHQSGIHDIINDVQFANYRTDTLSRTALIEKIAAQKPSFKPGKTTAYSNSNYILLGFIIEDLLHQPYSEVINERILLPLGMQHTRLETTETDPAKSIGCYKFNGEEWVLMEPETNPTITYAAGGMISTVSDLNIFMKALFNYQIISSAWIDTMSKVSANGYGHGLFYTPFESHKGYGHTGHIDEFHSAAIYMQADSISFIICLNGMNYKLNDIALGIMSYYFNAPYTFPEINRITLNSEQLNPYCGTYRLKLFHFIPITKIKMESAHGVIYTATENNFEEEKTIAEPIGADSFKNFTYNSTLQFSHKKNGAVKGCYLLQGKTKLYCRKLNS